MFSHGHACGHRGHGPPWARFGHRHGGGGHGHDHGGGGFGIRRPLRFLAHKLDLDEDQVQELAAVLDALKTERQQAAVDERRVQSAFADAVAGDVFDADKVKEAAARRVETAERLAAAVQTALEGLHGILDEEQRRQLALLLRAGPLSI